MSNFRLTILPIYQFRLQGGKGADGEFPILEILKLLFSYVYHVYVPVCISYLHNAMNAHAV